MQPNVLALKIAWADFWANLGETVYSKWLESANIMFI